MEEKNSIGYRFWRNVDLARKDISLATISRKTGLKYQLIKSQRSDNTLPRLDAAVILARALDTSCEELVFGDISRSPFFGYLPYLERCPEDRLASIRILLGMPEIKKGDLPNSGLRMG